MPYPPGMQGDAPGGPTEVVPSGEAGLCIKTADEIDALCDRLRKVAETVRERGEQEPVDMLALCNTRAKASLLADVVAGLEHVA